MKTPKQAQREAGRLFRLCQVNGSLDESRARTAVQRMLTAGHSGELAVLSRFQRLVRRDGERHRAEIASAAPLPHQVRSAIEQDLTRLYGPGLVMSFVEDPSLIGGLRLTVGSDVYDGSVRGGLAALEGRFGR